MADKIYRCGWCGFPCSEDGTPMDFNYDEATEYLRSHKDAEVQKVDGGCAEEAIMADAPTNLGLTEILY